MAAMIDSPFGVEQVLDAASAASGLDDFGDPWFREGLAVLLETYDRNVEDQRSRERCSAAVIASLVTRLKIQAAYVRHPEILEQRVKTPIFVTGLPRTGTSALVNLMAADPRSKVLLLWEIYYPEPLPGWRPGQPDPRHDAMVAHMEANRDPEFDKIHYSHPDLPEECVLMHQYSFDGVQTGWEILLEPYSRWFRQHDLTPLYREYRNQLKLLQWQRPGQYWVLKAPAHMWALPQIRELFPDARIVWGHRDVVSVTSSICSMTHRLMAEHMWDSRPSGIDAGWLGRQVMEWYAESLQRGLEFRSELPAGSVLDYDYPELVAEPMATATAIYRHLGLPLGAAARRAMEAHIAAHPQHRHGRHGHHLQQFGLTEPQVRERFAFYTGRFPVAAGG